MGTKYNKVSDEAVQKATGRDWAAWIELLDGLGARELSHKEIVALMVARDLCENAWWQQMVTVGYEHAIGRRTLGDTADRGFQIGVQRTWPVSVDEAWALVTGQRGQEAWLGPGAELALEPGATYTTDDGIGGEVRTLAEGKRLRLTWQPEGWAAPTTLQVTFAPGKAGKTAVRFHHEMLPDEAAREECKLRWKEALAALAALI